MQETSEHPFDRLTPSFIMDAIETQGFYCDCRIFALNSYENRVYQVGIEDGEPLIAKFYRPERWTDEQIREEHLFTRELAEQELPVVAPWCSDSGASLFAYDGFRFGLYPRKGGHAPELDNLDHLKVLGRLLARIHLIGARTPFFERPKLDSQSFGHRNVELICENFIPADYRESYQSLTRDLLQIIDERFAQFSDVRFIRTHGDCHSGNMLWREDAPNFVDFDDARMAPAIQDLWMLLSGEEEQQRRQMEKILEGYHEFNDFDFRELQLIEVLRTLRIINYSAWLATRWDDPAFPRTFPWFGTLQYWGEHILELREQMAALMEPALSL
ncbi:Ser/Thr protein kinase RdoA involved in Cpx stress response, MazF antagonist [Malonomonas rubra DSM 5091]|uniref:Stress response kinase A n=1 Tax=Malonomonas rubra DSM 5091 TaxID=1122189 RepID=A0A1M6MQE3_MALRU|nr:serine/threonine protein kinase [Malonomonas rubra]SHJ85718.1 Ser/Thr protein kinase RdoA involved in Cpx stress response, MazF antagonist [Malonomonas rubra DSM 5091]